MSLEKREPIGIVLNHATSRNTFHRVFRHGFWMWNPFFSVKLGSGIKDRVKFQTYECGLPSEEKRDTKVSVKFYLTAILFILFDIEIIFMYPWALTFQDFLGTTDGVAAFSAMMIFLVILSSAFFGKSNPKLWTGTDAWVMMFSRSRLTS